MSMESVILSIDPGQHIGYAFVQNRKVIEAGMIQGLTEADRFNPLQQKLLTYMPKIVLIENSYKYKKKLKHMLLLLSDDQRPTIYLRDANQVQFRLFGSPFGKYGKDNKKHREIRDKLVFDYFGCLYEVHANDALLMVIDWIQNSEAIDP
jgi:hypothetical protein